jgi:hypothetical protein
MDNFLKISIVNYMRDTFEESIKVQLFQWSSLKVLMSVSLRKLHVLLSELTENSLPMPVVLILKCAICRLVADSFSCFSFQQRSYSTVYMAAHL